MNQINWKEINRKAFEHSMRPVALPERDGIPYWNQHAKAFIMPPSFEVRSITGASSYHFILSDSQGTKLAEFRAKSPREPLTEVWGQIPVGSVQLEIRALDESGNVLQTVFQRNFNRNAWFHGPYPVVPRDYKNAAERCFSYIYHLPHIQAWLENGTVDEKAYGRYCYPSKMLSAIVRALFHYAETAGTPEVREKVLKISSRICDWLIENSCPAGTPLEYLPPTYWKYTTFELAVPHVGQIMMIYPMEVGLAYLQVYQETKLEKYLEAAVRLAETMRKLELPTGSWYLKFDEKTGAPLGENVVLITQIMMDFLTQLSRITGNSVYAAMRDLAYHRLLEHNLKMWDWDGQFEDVVPTEMYRNLTKQHAHSLAAGLFRKGNFKTALQIVDWSEDQFVVWSKDNPDVRDRPGTVIPTALEQYNCYRPVDASMGDFISIWTKTYQYTGDWLYLEKARAMADAVLRNQRADGSIPTWFYTTNPLECPDWLNCMNYTAETLLELAEVGK